MDFSEKPRPCSGRRILALWLPRLPIDRLTRKDASLFESPPLVIAGREGNRRIVQALDGRAQALGLRKGQPLAAARAMAGALTVRPADEKADAALLARIADGCERFSPFVAADPPQGVVMEITGAAHLFGGEAAMLAHVTARIAAQGLAVQGAIAGSAPAARALARFAPGHIAPPGQEMAALAPLPVAALDCDGTIVAALSRAGLKTIGQVTARARHELAARFGLAFTAALETMLGHQDQPIAPRRPAPDLMAERRFAEPITAADAIDAALLELAQALGQVLERHGLGLRMLEASFFRTDGQVRHIAVGLGGATRAAAAIMRLLRERLAALHDPLDPGFGFDLIRLSARLAERAMPAAARFDAQAEAGDAAAFLIDRLTARHGRARVLRFVAEDTHVPEAACRPVPAQDRPQAGPWRARRLAQDPPLRPLRLLHAPEAVNAIATVPDGPPLRFGWRRAHFDIAHAEGPERIAMPWWRGDHRTRDYFRVETRQGQRFWLYREGLYRNGEAPRWYLHGIFA